MRMFINFFLRIRYWRSKDILNMYTHIFVFAVLPI
jgi:hypothetical protein